MRSSTRFLFIFVKEFTESRFEILLWHITLERRIWYEILQEGRLRIECRTCDEWVACLEIQNFLQIVLWLDLILLLLTLRFDLRFLRIVATRRLFLFLRFSQTIKV